MIKFTCIFLSFASLSRLECIIDTPPPQTSKEVILHDDLMRNYKEQGSKSKNTTVPVTIRFLLKAFQFYNEEEEFLLHSWAFLSWHDDCLTWNAADYDSIDNTLINIRRVWSPAISLDNELGYEFGIFTSPLQKCQVFNTGLVACVPKVTHLVTCNSVLENWPYDTQTCHLNYTIKNNLNLTYANSRPISMLGAEYGTGWTIVAYEYTHPENLKDTLEITLTVERTAALLAAINVFPLIVIAVLSLGAMFIDVKNALRVYILCFCLACNFVFVQTINENIPEGGVGAPKVLIFLRNSILMAAISIVATFSLKNLRRRRKPTPTWVIQVNDFVLQGPRDRLVWPKWEAEVCEDDTVKKTLEDWNSFSYIFNFYLIIVYLITYLIFVLVYIPKPVPVTV